MSKDKDNYKRNVIIASVMSALVLLEFSYILVGTIKYYRIEEQINMMVEYEKTLEIFYDDAKKSLTDNDPTEYSSNNQVDSTSVLLEEETSAALIEETDGNEQSTAEYNIDEDKSLLHTQCTEAGREGMITEHGIPYIVDTFMGVMYYQEYGPNKGMWATEDMTCVFSADMWIGNDFDYPSVN